MSEIIQDNHETLRHTITIEPDDVPESLDNADDIRWYLTTSSTLGRGRTVLEKDISDMTVVDDNTFELELSPAETRELSTGQRYAEVTIIWDSGGKPSTTALRPSLKVVESKYDSS